MLDNQKEVIENKNSEKDQNNEKKSNNCFFVGEERWIETEKIDKDKKSKIKLFLKKYLLLDNVNFLFGTGSSIHLGAESIQGIPKQISEKIEKNDDVNNLFKKLKEKYEDRKFLDVKEEIEKGNDCLIWENKINDLEEGLKSKLKMKLIFITIDGVLCPHSWIDKNINDFSEFQGGRLDPEKLSIFCSKIKNIDSKVVIFDKKCYETEALWKEFQKNDKTFIFDELYNIGPNKLSYLVNTIVKKYSKDYIVEYAIITGNDNYFEINRTLLDHTVIVDSNIGLTPQNMDRTIELVSYIK